MQSHDQGSNGPVLAGSKGCELMWGSRANCLAGSEPCCGFSLERPESFLACVKQTIRQTHENLNLISDGQRKEYVLRTVGPIRMSRV